MILSLYAFMQKALPQAIGCLLLSLIALLLMTARYKIILFDNEMMIYEWKVAAMLPTLIPYQMCIRDRSRSQKDTIYLLEDVFEANGVGFISLNENFDTTTPYGKAMVGILSCLLYTSRCV